MGRITTLFGAVAALTLISTVAKSQDGCAPGWYYDGRQCVAETGPGYYDPPPPAYYPPPPPAYYPPPPPLPDSDYVPLADRGMQLRFDSEEARYSPPNPAFKTWNNCPPNFTVQDGLCKPYTGR